MLRKSFSRDRAIYKKLAKMYDALHIEYSEADNKLTAEEFGAKVGREFGLFSHGAISITSNTEGIINGIMA